MLFLKNSYLCFFFVALISSCSGDTKKVESIPENLPTAIDQALEEIEELLLQC